MVRVIVQLGDHIEKYIDPNKNQYMLLDLLQTFTGTL